MPRKVGGETTAAYPDQIDDPRLVRIVGNSLEATIAAILEAVPGQPAHPASGS